MTFPTEAPARLRDLARTWGGTTVNERASFQTWMLRFCEALGVATPEPPTDAYRFELPVFVVDREGRESTNFIDCWKAGHFALEAKASGDEMRNDALLRKAFGQVRNYVAHVSGDPPPYLMVLDVPRTLIVWDRWSGAYGDFAAGRRIALATLHECPDDIALLYDIFVQPSVRDPRGKAQLVTREIAAGLAELAAELESRGLDTERVARFLMRCVFSCFAEDVGLLPENLFRRTLETARNSGEPLAVKERAIHEIAACGVLRDLHDELDQFVAEAYGWAWPMEKEEILERLVALHDERVEEEKRGLIRWLRPEYQIPRFATAAPVLTLEITDAVPQPVESAIELRAWPATAVEQLSALGALVSQRPLTPDEIAAHFSGARRDLIARHLETLALMGEVVLDRDGRYGAARKVA